MPEAFDYDPDARFDDDDTGSAEVAQADYVQDVPTNFDFSQSQTSAGAPAALPDAMNAPLPGEGATVSAQDADDSARDQFDENPVTPQTQAALHAYIPEANEGAPTSSTEDQFSTAYDIIDQLDTLIQNAPALFFERTKIKVEREEVLTLFEELKDVLPVQLERASTLMREAEHRLENAQSQADAIISNAQAKSSGIINDANAQARILAGQENVVSLATQQARTILSTAQERANALTQGANDYTADSMRALDNQLVELRHSINTGLQVLQERQQIALQDLPHITPDDYPQH
ncbi:hypothetical protein [Alloscardovia criceti]|uniref:hypothetical protein n=1 Tax=Alloscardovia criceti TaxID=356828 RepID=UPI000374CEB1|nr:hypothetical protein [Alloscardovia criceti]